MALRLGTLVGFIRADDRGMRRALTDAELRMRGFQRDTEGRLRTLDGRFAASANRWGMVLRRAGGDGNFLTGVLGRIGGMAGSLGGVAGAVGKIAAGLGAAVPVAAGLAATLADILPAAGLAATATLAVASAAGALKIGMLGVSDAVSAAFEAESAAELEEALEGLSPNARAFVTELHGMKGAFDDLKESVQDRLFEGFDTAVQSLAKSALPVLSRSLKDSAGSLNAMAHGVADTAAGLASSGQLGKALDSANKGLANLSQLPAVLVQGLVQVGAAAGPSFERLTAAGGRALETLSQRMGAAFQSGAMQRAIENAIGLIGDLAQVAGNVGQIVGSIFSAANASGAGFVGVLQQVTGALADAFASPAVQSGLKAIFETMGTLASTVAPLLVMALQAIAPVFTALGPPVQRLIEALGAALSPIIEALGPVLEAAAMAVGALVDAFSPLLPVLGQLVAAILPAITPLFTALKIVFDGLAPIIAQIAQILGDTLAPIITGLVPVIEPLVEILATQLVMWLQVLGNLLVALGPSLVVLGEALGQLLTALGPLIEAWGMLSTTLLTALMPLLNPIIALVGRLAKFLADDLAHAITGVVVPAVNMIAALLRGDFSGALNAGKALVRGFVDNLRRRFVELPSQAAQALAMLAVRLRARINEAGGQMLQAFARKRDDLLVKVRGLPGKAAQALSGIGAKLFGAGAKLIQGFIDGIASKFESVKSKLGELTSMLPSLKGPEDVDKRLLIPSGRWLIEGLQRGIDGQIPALRGQLQALTRDLPGMGGMDMAMGGMPGGMRFGGSSAPHRVEVINRNVIDVRGGEDDIQRLIRSWVDVEGGGNVQLAFGKN